MRTLTPPPGTRRAFTDAYDSRVATSGLAPVWRDVCDYAGLCHRVRTPTGDTIVVPKLVDVAGYDPTTVMVRLLPGMLVEDVREVASRLAAALGGVRLTAAAVGTDYARLVLYPVDPLGAPYAVGEDEGDGFLGTDEDGADVAVPWARRVHMLVQGSTGRGKSTLLYSQLAPLAGRADVRVAGVDPSGLVFRPWAGAPSADLRVSGLAGNLTEHIQVLTRLCEVMDERLGLLPPGVDNLAPTADVPLLVVVLEELSALLRTADADRKVAAVVRPLLGRLFSEGRKVAVRMLAAIPRADAAVLGAGIRDQAGLRVSFGVEAEGLRMLHDAVTAGIDPAEHVMSPAGIAVVSAPGLGTLRIRAGSLSYRGYCARVVAALA